MIEIIPYIILAIEDDGDREFMAWLYIQYQSLLYSEIIRIVQSSTDAEDILHTVIEKLIDKVGFLRKLDRRGLVNYIIIRAYRTLLLSAPKNILTTVDKSGIKSYPFVCIVWTGVSKYKERNSANL